MFWTEGVRLFPSPMYSQRCVLHPPLILGTFFKKNFTFDKKIFTACFRPSASNGRALFTLVRVIASVCHTPSGLESTGHPIYLADAVFIVFPQRKYER